ncbi:hypothetical protein GVX82_05170 [Patescibacteria group bacterium]|jgi:hypothetical protein|nr:hypothetical protein [Patescibacteria group bacterium]
MLLIIIVFTLGQNHGQGFTSSEFKELECRIIDTQNLDNAEVVELTCSVPVSVDRYDLRVRHYEIMERGPFTLKVSVDGEYRLPPTTTNE